MDRHRAPWFASVRDVLVVDPRSKLSQRHFRCSLLVDQLQHLLLIVVLDEVNAVLMELHPVWDVACALSLSFLV